ncbi:hypothetical protein GCM10007973_18400 [Polymorphobacter multimanifer]|uniref:Head-tail adaptor n=1 Tax=Polymorphobacter multimanifer TaxID=1070431 RepID=A0A841LEW5_9SPHN|nr:head-tail adaptor protein [Polymorphobacter multimanifer]MBB6228355.1 head-tail adaptor [Polymorphobacter multimanifer]GGI82264.1 hypothetical protein GCM10007973_18400 [Polymorphobacter multimanifer]
MIGAGDLRERVIIQRQTVASDGAGGEVRDWEQWLSLAASVKPTRAGGEAVIGEAVQGVQGFTVIVRFVNGIDITNRLLWRGRVLKVLSAVDMTGKRAFTSITTDDGVVTE